MKQLLTATWAGLATIATSVQAHEGHGLPGASHWHASDTVGYTVLVAVIAVAWWSTRRK
ncbi:hypothetical protein [Azohydromonas australica]|uniref:hypothetical protein n=1 Tax=Azohydromonas australica TaxID=364039 RepID=UPI0004230538|nr:hypothetical protein [Azohydromonas australica]